MPLEVILPRVDMDMATGKIVKWLVQDGETVKAGQVIFEIETDKATMEIESPGSGVIGSISAKDGETRPVGEAVAMIYAEGETAGVPPVARKEAPPPPVAPVPPTTPTQVQVTRSVSGIRATPLARRLAKETGVKLERLKGTGPRGRIVAADIKPQAISQIAAVMSVTCDVTRLLSLADRIGKPDARMLLLNKALARAAGDQPADIKDFAPAGIEMASAVLAINPLSLALGAATGTPPRIAASLAYDAAAVAPDDAARILSAFKTYAEDPALMLA